MISKISYGLLFTTIVYATACKVPKQLTLPERSTIPEQFAHNKSLGNTIDSLLSLQQFYKDAHLQKLIENAFQENFDIKSAMQRLMVANAEWKVSKGLWFPSVNFGVNGSATKFGKYTMEGVGNFDTNLSPNIEADQRIKTNPVPNYLLGFGLQWELDLWGKFKNLRKAGKERFLATEEARKMVIATVATTVAQQYYQLIALDQELRIFEENSLLLDKALEIIKIQKEVGRATELAVKQFEAQVLNTEAEKELVRQQIIAVENQIKILIGQYDTKIERSKSIKISEIAQIADFVLPHTILLKRPDVQSAYHELEASKANAIAVRASFFPSLTLGGNMGMNAFAGKVLFNPASFAWSALGGLTAPIWQKNQLRSQYNVATAQQLDAFYNYEKVAITAYNEVSTLLYQIQSYDKIYQLKSEEVKALDNAIDVSNDLYVSGYANYLEIIAAQKSKLDANIQRIEMLKEQAHCMIMLYKSVGGAWK